MSFIIRLFDLLRATGLVSGNTSKRIQVSTPGQCFLCHETSLLVPLFKANLIFNLVQMLLAFVWLVPLSKSDDRGSKVH